MLRCLAILCLVAAPCADAILLISAVRHRPRSLVPQFVQTVKAYSQKIDQMNYQQQVSDLERLLPVLAEGRAAPHELRALHSELSRLRTLINVLEPAVEEPHELEAAAEAAAEEEAAAAAEAEEAEVARIEAEAKAAAEEAAQAVIKQAAMMKAAATASAEAEAAAAAKAAEAAAKARAEAKVEAAMVEAVESVAALEDPRTVITIEHEHGRDPRLAPPWVSQNTELIDDLTAKSKATPTAATMSKSASVSMLRSVADFEAAIERAEASQRVIVIKFYSARCRSCLNAKRPYEKLAEANANVDFYEVDTAVARVLCAFANIQTMPVVHTYVRGELQSTRAINNPKLFSNFEAGLSLIAKGYAA